MSYLVLKNNLFLYAVSLIAVLHWSLTNLCGTELMKSEKRN